MKADAGSIEVSVGGEFLLRVDGGATVNNLLMQLQVSSCYFCQSMYCEYLGFTNHPK
jgi:glycerol kinase